MSSSRVRANQWTQFEEFKPRNWSPRVQVAALAVAGGTVYYVYQWVVLTKMYIQIHYLYSLEQVPMTGRWRFIDVTPQEERRYEMQTYNELLKEYEGQVLDPSHPLSVYVRQVVNRLLEASELGRVKDESDLGTPGDTWDTDSSHDERHGGGEMGVPLPRIWKLLVVNDPLINAMASSGIRRYFSPTNPYQPNGGLT